MELTKEIIKNWWFTTGGDEHHYKSSLDGLYMKSEKTFTKLRSLTRELVADGVITRAHQKMDGWYRLTDKADEEIVWWEGEDIDDSHVNLFLPFGLHKACYISRPSLIIIAGDTNAGKTAIILNILNLNLEKYQDNMLLLMTEGLDSLKHRFAHLNPPIPVPPPFKTFRKISNFEDDVLPDGLTLIDWLRPPDSMALMSIGAKLEAIYKKLKTGIAVIAIQKPRGERTEGFGGVITQWDANLAMSVHGQQNPRYVKLSKIKKPLILDRNLYQLKIKFNINYGIRLEELEKVYE